MAAGVRFDIDVPSGPLISTVEGGVALRNATPFLVVGGGIRVISTSGGMERGVAPMRDLHCAELVKGRRGAGRENAGMRKSGSTIVRNEGRQARLLIVPTCAEGKVKS